MQHSLLKKLNRSFSAPSISSSNEEQDETVTISHTPFVRRLYVEQLYQRGKATELKHYSYHRIYNSVADLNKFPKNVPEMNDPNLICNFSSLRLNSSNLSDNLDDSPVPMDVDFSDETPTLEEVNSTKEPTTKARHRRTKLSNRSEVEALVKQRKSYFLTNVLYVCITLIMLLLIYCMVLRKRNLLPVEISKLIGVKQLKTELSEGVYKQNDAIELIVHSLEVWPTQFKILTFVGSSGIGKTHVTNILKKHLHQANIQELNSVSLTNFVKQMQIIESVREHELNFVLVEDLYIKDLTLLLNFIQALPNDRFILFVSIFSTQYSDDYLNYSIRVDDVDKIQAAFSRTGIQHEMVVFEGFSKTDVTQWIEKLLASKGVTAVGHQRKIVEKILRGHFVTYRGLKGLNSKVLLELDKLRYA